MKIVEMFKALSDETRIRIVNLLLVGELCVCEIEMVLNLSQPNASRHLAKLKAAEILETQKVYQWVYYKINPELKLNHQSLIEYLKNILDTEKICESDINKLKTYREGEGGCSKYESSGQLI